MPRFTTQDGLGLHFEEEGDGLPVLCLAGLTRNGGDFEFLMPHLDLAHVRAIRMDYRGRGQSDHAADFMTYSILQEAQDAVALLDHLGIERAAIIGTSRGGLIAMVLAGLHRDRLAGVVLNDIGPDIAQVGLARIMDYVGRAPSFPDLDAAGHGLHALYEADFPGVPVERWRRQAELMWYEKPGGGLGLRYDARLRNAMIAQAEAGPTPDLWPLFDQLATVPLCALRGANSDLLTPETLDRMQAHIPGMAAVTVADRAHVPFLDEPEAVAAIHALLEQAR
ncbi:alpha/beta hydrolase [Roseovarius sp. SCSIO 43702]|uniref:alpha/beta fold hydrolase n=1 Tax=Roseovarius sp. SCSIO 43702 TaxID=2823043 RepID=UPI001C73AFA8|nr:alpha/beta fold hydrolase [Roseovarius sp. SCSIO 43702]QYX55931.1 alpha/beta hydrolase [Roseovarius sp. SCSIO 43702]